MLPNASSPYMTAPLDVKKRKTEKRTVILERERTANIEHCCVWEFTHIEK